MKIKVDMHHGNWVEFTSVDLIKGEQGLISDDFISFRIIKNGNTYVLSEPEVTIEFETYMESYCGDYRVMRNLKNEFLKAIREMESINSDEVENFRTSGFISWLAQKVPSLDGVEGFDILKLLEILKIKINDGQCDKGDFNTVLQDLVGKCASIGEVQNALKEILENVLSKGTER